MKMDDLRATCLVKVVAERRRDCECPCREAGHQGECRIWIWPGVEYWLALTGDGRRARTIPLCAECVRSLHGSGHLATIENRAAFPRVGVA